MKKLMSFVFPLLLIAGIIAAAFIKIKNHNTVVIYSFINIDLLLIGLYLMWIVFELTVSRHDVIQKTVVSDYGTRELYGLSHSLTILSALLITPLWSTFGIHYCIGFIIFIAGVVFRIWAISTLGKYYSHVVRKIEAHRIIDTGPYRYIRHPAYTGMIIAHTGITIFYFNYYTLAALLLLLIPSIIVRIIIEEKTPFTIDGYLEFAKTRKRIIPYVW